MQESLRDNAKLDVPMIGIHFSAHGFSIILAFSVQVLRAGKPSEGCHGLHPEMIGVGSQDAQSGFEGDFDFESQSVEADDFQGRQAQVRAQENDPSSGGVNDGDKSDEDAHGSPQQVEGSELDFDPSVGVNGAGGSVQGIGIVKEGAQPYFLSIFSGAASSLGRGGKGWPMVGHRIGSDASDQMVALSDQSQDEGAGGVIGVGDGNKRGRSFARIGSARPSCRAAFFGPGWKSAGPGGFWRPREQQRSSVVRRGTIFWRGLARPKWHDLETGRNLRLAAFRQNRPAYLQPGRSPTLESYRRLCLA